MSRRSNRLGACFAAFIVAGTANAGGGGDYPPLPPIGSNNVSVADPVVSRPSSTPCSVTLFDDFIFNDFTPRDFAYAAPSACTGPWAKVVLTGDFYVTAGVQYDRTAKLWIGGTMLLFGTTPEPTGTLSPSWHVERDVTDYSELLASADQGRVYIANLVDGTYTGVIHGSATLEFYPISPTDPAPTVPDQVVLLGGDANGSTTDLSLPTDQQSTALSLPTNIERAYLDVYLQSQNTDEFWWTCMPDDVAPITNDCPGTAFREGEVSIDGQPAGVVPVYPWIYTGGIQPRMWMPIPGVETLNFDPYRVDLTPFAGILSDGTTHTLAISVFNTHAYFSVASALLLYLDAGSTNVTGEVTTNTIGAGPAPVVVENIDGSGIGDVVVTSDRTFTLTGYVETSHGHVETSIDQTLHFTSTNTYTASVWSIDRGETIDSTTTVTSDDPTLTTTEHLSYPLTFSYTLSGQPIDVDMAYERTIDEVTGSDTTYSSALRNEMTTHYQGAAASRYSAQQYTYTDSTGACYDRNITATANQLATVTDNIACIALDTIFANGFDP